MHKPAPSPALALLVAFGLSLSPWRPLALGDENRPTVYRSPFELAFSPDGRVLALSDHTAGSLVLLDAATGNPTREIALSGKPAGVVWSADGRFVYVAECGTGSVAEIDRSGKISRRLKVGPRPIGLALAPRRGWLLAANSGTNTVSLVELADGRERARVAVPRMPYLLAITPDEKTAVVGNRLPDGDASDPSIGAVVTLIDLASGTKAVDIRLPANATNVHGVAVSPDSKWAYVVHNLGRAMLPTEQIEYGWINANAMTTIDLALRKRYATILLDRMDDGAANPWGTAVSNDGTTLWITLAGVHQVGKLDLMRLHRLLRAELPEIVAQQEEAARNAAELNTARGSMAYSESAQTGVDDRTSVEVVISDLPAEYGQGRYFGRMFHRIDLPGNGPRGLAISPDGRQLAVGLYYSGTVSFVDPQTAAVTKTVSVVDQSQAGETMRGEADETRRGEMIFHDATYCFQHWLSCATCHPDGRADGLNWDLLNDGIGNPKNTKSLLLAHRTPPAMATGVRAGMQVAAAAGFQFILFQEPKPQDLRAVEAYLRAMRPVTSPYRLGGRLSDEARRGKALFESPRTRCTACHPAPLYTDRRLHDVGTRDRVDETSRFDTPTLIELWRTAPYLHHGRARTLRDVFTEMNANDQHGRTSNLSNRDLSALIEYLKSL